MPVIARDAVASDHLVYAWPFPIGPEELEIACADDEQVVMCPAWVVGDRLGPGRHRWRTPDPSRPVSAYFVLTAPVEVSFDMQTSFLVPTTALPVRLRATGALHVRCADPGLLIAQFVGLPFDAVNEGIVRSVSRSVERMLARLLTRRVVMAGTPAVVTDPQMLPNVIEELVAYNPAAGAVFGVELMRFGHLAIVADDGTQPWTTAPANPDWASNGQIGPNGETERVVPPLAETLRTPRADSAPAVPDGTPTPRHTSVPPGAMSGEIVPRASTPPPTPPTTPPPPPTTPAPAPAGQRVITTPLPTRRAGAVEVPQTDEITQPGAAPPTKTAPMGSQMLANEEPRGSILGIGVGHIGGGQTASGEIATKVAPGARVLVPGPDGLMQSATVRQLLQGYYELEVGGSGETIWVPVSGVVPE